jgi:Cu2+-exporting ATPase
MTVLLAAGERIPVDAVVVEGRSDIDTALATGESLPLAANPAANCAPACSTSPGPLTIRRPRRRAIRSSPRWSG